MLYVLHGDSISLNSQEKLKNSIKEFNNAALEFINMGDRFDKTWGKTFGKYHFSKEIFFKLIIPSTFPKYSKIIITDVDVLWLGDISEEFNRFNCKENYYIGGYGPLKQRKKEKIQGFVKNYYKHFKKNEIHRFFNVGAGLLIYNLEKMRKDNIENLFIQFAFKNSHLLVLPEQDIINYVCYPKIKIMSKNGLITPHHFLNFDTEEKLNNASWTKEEILEARNNPIQFHYAGSAKPWLVYTTFKSSDWFRFLAKTNYLEEWLENAYKFKEEYEKYIETKSIISTSIFEIGKSKSHIRFKIRSCVIILPKAIFRVFKPLYIAISRFK